MNTFSLKELLAFIAKCPNDREINMLQPHWRAERRNDICGCLLVQFALYRFPEATGFSAGFRGINFHEREKNLIGNEEVIDLVHKLIAIEPKTYGAVKKIVGEMELK